MLLGPSCTDADFGSVSYLTAIHRFNSGLAQIREKALPSRGIMLGEIRHWFVFVDSQTIYLAKTWLLCKVGAREGIPRLALFVPSFWEASLSRRVHGLLPLY